MPVSITLQCAHIFTKPHDNLICVARETLFIFFIISALLLFYVSLHIIFVVKRKRSGCFVDTETF